MREASGTAIGAAVVAGFCVSLLALRPSHGSAQEPDFGAALNEWVEEGRKRWGIPGLAVAVVHGDSVLALRGYGVRTVGTTDPVDANTVFALGSVTKTITAVALASLVESGELSWDQPARRWMPCLRLADPWATDRLTVRDALSHRSGLPRTLFLFFGRERSHPELLRRLRFVQPVREFRSGFGYQNVVFATVAQGVIEATADTSWAGLLHDRFFQPLGMDRTLTGIASIGRTSNVADPHIRTDGDVRVVPWRDLGSIAPAGAAAASAGDLSRWLLFLLSLGEGEAPAAAYPLSAEGLAELWEPQVVVPETDPARLLIPDPVADGDLASYGLGWFVHSYRGHRIAWHGGDIDGMAAALAIVPEERLGVAVLSNLQLPQSLPYSLMYRVIAEVLGENGAEAAAALDSAGRRAARERSALRQQLVSDTLPRSEVPDHSDSRLEGDYFDPVNGVLSLSRGTDAMRLSLGSLEASLAPRGGGAYFVAWDDPVLDNGLPTLLRVVSAEGLMTRLELRGVGTFRRLGRSRALRP